MKVFVLWTAMGIALAATSFSSIANATEIPDQAHHNRKMLDQDIALALAPIRSREQLDSYLHRTPKGQSPLDRLSPPAKSRFIESLTFNETGLTGFRYDDLQAELSASQAYRILSLFGAQHTTRMLKQAKVESLLDAELLSPAGDGSGPVCPSQPCDYAGYMCEGRATCAPNINTICMRNC